jgi:CheY-like chemotaxis protein
MSRILLVDDSPHAQRMGERILSEEGYEVVTVSNADSALIRLEDVDPDVVLADTVMPGRTGFDICQYLKMSPRHRHVRVILTAGVLETLETEQAKRVEADGTLRKPFEASALLAAVKPLAESAAAARAAAGNAPAAAKTTAPAQAAIPFVAVVDGEQVRAAVTVALDASMDAMVEEITRRVLAALSAKKSGDKATEPVIPLGPPAALSAPRPVAPTAASPRIDAVRRVSPVRIRPSSILGLELTRAESDEFGPRPAIPDSPPAGSEPRPPEPTTPNAGSPKTPYA